MSKYGRCILLILLSLLLIKIQTYSVVCEEKKYDQESQEYIEIEDQFINPVYENCISIDDLLNIEPSTESDNFESSKTYNGITYTKVSDIVNSIKTGMVNRQSKIELNIILPKKSVSNVKENNELFKYFLVEAVKHTGKPNEGDYLLFHFGGYSASGQMSDANDVYQGTLIYNMLYYTDYDQEKECDSLISSILADLQLNNLPDIEKIKRIYKYLCDNITYDYENLYDRSDYLKYTAYGAVKRNKCVCQGYANLIYRLFLASGIDSRIIAGYAGESHAWNIVKLAGKYYNIDSTWDAGCQEYEWFLKNETDFPRHIRENLSDNGFYDYNSSDFNLSYPIASKSYIPVKGVKITPDYYLFTAFNQEYDLQVNVYPEDATIKDIKLYSSDSSVIETRGLDSIAAIDEGHATITVCTDDGGYRSEIFVESILSDFIPVEEIILDKQTITILEGDRISLNVTVLPDNASYKNVSWISDDPNIAQVDKGGTIYGIAKGETTLNCISMDGTVKAECHVAVEALKEGFLKDEDGVWKLYTRNEVRKGFSGLYPYGSSLFYLTKGVLDKSVNGIYYSRGVPYYVVNGKVTFNYTGLGEYKGSLFYFSGSEKDTTFNGISYYKNEPYYVVNGQVTYNYTGLGEYKGSLHYFEKSKKDFTYSGISYFQDVPYYVLNGIVTYNYNGIAPYKNSKWYVKNSIVDKTFSGLYKWKGNTYSIKNGKVY